MQMTAVKEKIAPVIVFEMSLKIEKKKKCKFWMIKLELI